MSKLSKVEFLSTSAGAYGLAQAGDKLVVDTKVAEELEKKGILKITGAAAEGAEASIPENGSVRFIDLTNVATKAAPPAKETDPKNPTGAKPKATTKKGK